MQIVIDINEHLYKTIKTLGIVVEDGDAVTVSEAIINGTPLPKGHGKLKDIDKIISDGINKGFCEWYDEMENAPTVIEADEVGDTE